MAARWRAGRPTPFLSRMTILFAGPRRVSRFRWVLLALGVGLAGAAPVVAQSGRWDLKGGLPVGSEEETYLRDLQVAGLAPLYPWTIRGFTYGELARVAPTDTLHPWHGHFDLSAPPSTGLHVGLVSPEVSLIGNSGYPFGSNDGMVWAGRGLTSDVRAGFWLTWGRLHLRVAPEAFVAQNTSFPLASNGRRGEAALRDSRYPGAIDRPQRFGVRAYNQVGLGSSELTLTLPGVVLGVSGASQTWGPGYDYPLLISDNAGGFDHAFIQTSRPLGIGIGRLHARLIIGRLAQSKWSPAPEGTHDRFVSAVVASFQPRGVPGLEIGIERFVDRNWSGGGIGLAEILRPFGGIISVGGPITNPKGEDQMAGLFFRWAVPKAGVEVYAEAVREDFSRDFRDLIVRPDDYMGRTLGVRRVMKLSGTRLLAIHGEVVSAMTHHSERDNRYRVAPTPNALYTHSSVKQGWTQVGQVLGSPVAFGGSGWTLGTDLYGPRGRWSTEIFYEQRQDWLHDTKDGTGVPDALYGVGFEAVRFHGAWDYSVAVRPSVDLNRNVQPGNDVFNLNVILAVRGMPW